MKQPQLVLASASPRRRELLAQIGLDFLVQTADIDEAPRPDETAEALVRRLAQEKSVAVWKQRAQMQAPALPVLGSDTLGVLNGELLVKPTGFEDARQMLRNMSGQQHEILTAVALTDAGGTRVAVNRNRVKFRVLTDQEILAYWRTGEPQDKAGSYAIQGYGAIFVEHLEGSYSGVMGLPLYETAQLLGTAGIIIF
ncbi:nucleoside triphosphate pyrophosphatase [Candidatus Thiothrix sp. Deng01]|uniref:dTTP/UTP pyrophosphatase n=1 Tax=Candidatus Thiothrix phosphatis TaxID=3112415 RepID=A0ABU6CTG4_9GAMM|nr:nucleoside triphosphate pyrophosphatase [Candidatus Thiothrix sp. Deng01]MEB4589372.1 nucleoside triphosphate pyrophosphatase [Candidatus Thiothrix sp. Deng01]